MQFTVNTRLGPTGLSIFAEMSALAVKHGAINLGQGFPDYNPPDDLLALISRTLSGQVHQYAPMQGVGALRESIAAKMTLDTGFTPNADLEITVTAGATQAIFAAIMALIQAGDEVIILEPCYDSYRPSIQAAGGIAVASQMVYRNSGSEGDGRFSIDWDDLEACVTDKASMIIIHSC